MNQTDVAELHNYINGIEETIQFTIEYKNKHKISFLELLAIKKNTGELATQLYKKPTLTHRFLNCFSQHAESQKRGLVKTLLHGARSNLITESEEKKTKKFRPDYKFYMLMTILGGFWKKNVLEEMSNKEIEPCRTLMMRRSKLTLHLDMLSYLTYLE